MSLALEPNSMNMTLQGRTYANRAYAGGMIVAQILMSILASRDLGEAAALVPSPSHARENSDRLDHATHRLTI